MKRRLGLVLAFGLTLSACIHSQQPTKRMSDSSSARKTPVGVGEPAPEFTLEDQTNQKVTLSSARGQRPVVLVFYRGYW